MVVLDTGHSDQDEVPEENKMNHDDIQKKQFDVKK
jgi:hypothetical protein